MVPLHDQLAGCEVPALLVAGSCDAKFCAIAEQLAAALPESAVTVIEGAGHAAHIEQPDTTAAAITEFMGRAEADRAEKADPVGEVHRAAEADLVAGLERVTGANQVAAGADRAAVGMVAEGGPVMEADAG